MPNQMAARLCLCLFAAFWSLFYLPKLLTQGVFLDGLVYSSIARNMAQGKGEFWRPFFSSSYWLPYNVTDTFYEHPPLMFGAESLLFATLGDHWYVEKIFSTLVMLATLWLLWRVWAWLARHHLPMLAHWQGLPWLLWCALPAVGWTATNNMLDNFMAFFCLASVYWLLPLVHGGPHFWRIAAAAMCLLAAFLSKGPGGLFPLAAPALLWLALGQRTWKNASQTAAVSTAFLMAAAGLFALLMLHAPARHFMEVYWQQQVWSAATGTREGVAGNLDARVGSLYERMLIVRFLALHLCLLAAPLLAALLALRLLRTGCHWPAPLLRWAVFFLLVALSASLPLALVPKQSTHYLVPATPFLALAFGLLLLPPLQAMAAQMPLRFAKVGQAMALLGLAAGLAFSVARLGKPRTHANLIAHATALRQLPAPPQLLAVCRQLMDDGWWHAYLQRYARIELTQDMRQSRYLLIDRACADSLRPLLRQQGYAALPLADPELLLMQRQGQGQGPPMRR